MPVVNKILFEEYIRKISNGASVDPEYIRKISNEASTDPINVKLYGAKGDARIVNDGEATVGSTTVTSLTANFTEDDVGKIISVSGQRGAAFYGFNFTTIASVNSPTSVELTDAITELEDNVVLTILIGSDDTEAINAAFDELREKQAAWRGWATGTDKLSFPPGIYIVTDSINATNIRGRLSIIDGNGAKIISFASGVPVFDMCDTRFNYMRDFYIASTDIRSPSWAILHGRGDSGLVADNMSFENIVCDGNFTQGGLINVAAETCFYKSCRFSNTLENSPAIVLDASNQSNALSKYDTLVTSGSSMNNIHFIHSYFDTFTRGAGSSIKILGDVTGGQDEEVRDILFDGCYANVRYDPDVNTGVEGEETASVIYCNTKVQNLEWKGRMERTHYIKHLIEFDNTEGELRCDGLVVREHYLASTHGAIGCTKAQGDNNAGFVIITNGNIRIAANSQVKNAPDQINRGKLFGGRTAPDGTGNDISNTIQYWGTIDVGRDTNQADLSMLHTFNGIFIGRIPRPDLKMAQNGTAMLFNQTNILELKGTIQNSMSGILGKFVLNDDQAMSFTPTFPKGALTIAISEGVIFAFYKTLDPAETVVVNTSDIALNNVSATSGILEGNTGTDGNLNISAHTDGKIYIENRRGATRTLSISVSC